MIFYSVRDEKAKLVMVAPLYVISSVFGFHPSAEARVVAECGTLDGRCEMHFNRRPNPLGLLSASIQFDHNE